MYTDASIYYMSGTGNSYRAAIWSMGRLKENTVNVSIHSISNPGEIKTDVKDGEEGLFMIFFPTHGFTAPWNIFRFAFKAPVKKRTHAVIVAARAGLKLGPLFFPGLEGTAAYLIAFILALKGYRIKGVMGLDMPSNWMALHPGLCNENASAIIERAHYKTENFIENILAGYTCYWNIEFFLLGILLIPISLLYLMIGRFFLAKLFFASFRCTGCGLCSTDCPFKAIRMQGKNKKIPFWTYSCESCMRCMAFCPEKAVEASQSLAVIFYFITSVPVFMFLFKWLTDIAFPQFIAFHHILTAALYYVYILFSIWITYLLFSLLIRNPLINRLFTYTTLTHIYRRYHEPETHSADLK